MRYPTTFSDTLEPLPSMWLDECSEAAFETLANEGFTIESGLRAVDVAEIAVIAGQDSVREFCPKDAAKRFGDELMVANWLEKGRGMFLLRHLGNDAIAGYGWTGPEHCKELPECDTTFALRLNQEYAGRGLGAPFTTAILAGSAALFGKRSVGLETWASNTGAVLTYLRAGASLITTKDDVRPTLAVTPREQSGKRQDVRLFMSFAR